MGIETKIQWTHHSFNPWWGCAKVSPGCKNCYAESFAKRTGHKVWGEGGPRRFFAEKHWNEPRKWARAAAEAGERRRVFCASMADVFEDHPALEPERQKLWTLIRETASACHHHEGPYLPASTLHCGLDWLLLTKRPENILRMAPADVLPLVWAGTTVEDQEHADKRIPALLQVPAAVRFLSCEPLLGPVDFDRIRTEDDLHCLDLCGIDWIIVGGESGPGARPFDLAWAREIRDQCTWSGVNCFVKQLGAVAMGSGADVDAVNGPKGRTVGAPAGPWRLALDDKKGGDPSEWPADLRVREFPEVRRA